MTKLVILKTVADFEKFQKSRAYHNPLMRLRVAFNNQNIPRFGFIIPKKVVPKVTDRNKIKRRLKGILRQNLEHMAARDLLIFPKKEALYLKYEQLNNETVKLLKQSKLWK